MKPSPKATSAVRYSLSLAVLFFLVTIPTGSLKAQDTSSTGQKKNETTKVEISDFGWIAGHWQGKAMGGEFEETWNPAMGGEMMGMFKFVKNGKVVFYEILTIIPKGDSYTLRLKHFDKNFVGWEEKEKSVEFPLKKISKNKIEFDGLVFEKQNKDSIKITVTTKSNGKISKLVFPCQRKKVSSKSSK